MKAEFEKKMLMSSELLSYCHLRGATEYHLDLKVENEATILSIKAWPAKFTDEEMELLQKKLNAPRQREIEQDFWGLSGESEISSELTLVGMMCDEADIKYEDDVLYIYLKRLL